MHVQWTHTALFSLRWPEPQRCSPSLCCTTGRIVSCNDTKGHNTLLFSDPCDYLTREWTTRLLDWLWIQKKIECNTWLKHTSTMVCTVQPLKGAKPNTIPDSYHELNLTCCLVLLTLDVCSSTVASVSIHLSLKRKKVVMFKCTRVGGLSDQFHLQTSFSLWLPWVKTQHAHPACSYCLINEWMHE